jgi:hypothetical protein
MGVEHDLGRFLMAVAQLLGAWGEMLIPNPNRPTLVEYKGRWKLDERGYPVPSEAMRREYEQLLRSEQAKN